MPGYQDLRDAPPWVREWAAETAPPPIFTLADRLALYSDDPDEARALRAARIVESGEGETIVTEDDYLRFPHPRG